MNYNFDFLGGLQSSHPGSSLYSGFGLNNQHPPMSTFKDDLFSEWSDEDENGSRGGGPTRLPLFGRCPLTNKAYLDTGVNKPVSNLNLKLGGQQQENEGIGYKSRVMGDISNVASNRIPLLQISNQLCNVDLNKANSPKKISWSQIAKKPAQQTPVSLPSLPSFPTVSSPSNLTISRPTMTTFEEASKLQQISPGAKKALNPAKPSLDDVKDNSIVALTNKHGKGKYWFKSGCPTPDPRWSSKQQLMIGPIPGDVEYAVLRSAFLSKGQF